MISLALLTVGLCRAEPAHSATQPSLIVVPRPSPQIGLSYFKLITRAGPLVHAGTVELRNPSARRLAVELTGVNGQTLSTLGSGYAAPGSREQGSARWLRIGRRIVTLAPRQSALVGVSVDVPRGGSAGDYLSGVSIEALGQNAQDAGTGVAIASVDRYVIGVEVSVPGPRHPLIRFTGAALERQPAGLSFLLHARNAGNVILQKTHGRALITEGSRTVAETALGPGTFVSGTSIAYPIPTPREHPREGTLYRVRAYLHYAGGLARLDTLVRFGRAAALAQQNYGGPRAPAARPSRTHAWLLGSIGALFALSLALFGALLIRRRGGRQRPGRALEAALVSSRERDEPLAVLTLTPPIDTKLERDGVALVRARLRKSDRLCRLKDGQLMVIASDSDDGAAEALAADLRRQLARIGGAGGVTVEVHCPDVHAPAAELLQRISEASDGVLTTSV